MTGALRLFACPAARRELRRFGSLTLAVVAFVLTAETNADAGLTRSDLSAIALTPEIGKVAPFDLEFERVGGSRETLTAITGNKDALLTFADFDCPSLCGVALAALGQRLAEGNLEIGHDYELIIVGLDAKDDFENRTNLIASSGTGSPILEQAHFVRSDQEDVDRLASSLGYTYQYDQENDVFAHPNGVLVMEPNGTIKAAFNEFSISADAIEDTLLGTAKPSSFRQMIRSVCYNFDPLSGQYTLAITRIMKIAGSLFVILLVSGLILALRRERAAHV